MATVERGKEIIPSVLQQIAIRFEDVDPDKARELRRIDSAYIRFGLNDDRTSDPREDAASHLLRYLPRMAHMRNFRLYRIGVGEQANGSYAHQAVALLEARHLPTPGNTLVVLDPKGISPIEPLARDSDSHQYSFEVWRDSQQSYGHGCALITDRQLAPTAS